MGRCSGRRGCPRLETDKHSYPEALADKAWDNVGLLLDNVDHPGGEGAGVAKDGRHRVLLTVDLTPDVVEEAVQYGVGVVVAYHPIIFRGLKALTGADSQQASLLRLARHNIAVYCPHTALDAATGGINDWLAEAVQAAAAEMGCVKMRTSVIRDLAQPPPALYRPATAAHTAPLTGYGRVVRLARTVPAPELIRRVVRKLGLTQKHVLVARPRVHRQHPGLLAPAPAATAAAARLPPGEWTPTAEAGTTAQIPPSVKEPPDAVGGVAVCAGSGFDILRETREDYVDMYFTGEVSHHDALAATTRGKWVVCLLHSNSERRFLAACLQPQLTAALRARDARFGSATVLVSECDRDPFEIWAVDGPAAAPKDSPGLYAV